MVAINKRIKIPQITSPYKRIYIPAPDTYKGIDTPSFKYGELHNEWIVNDFTFIKRGDTWHSFGITHPRPTEFMDDFNFSGDVHEAEFQLFHAEWKGDLESLYKSGQMTDRDKILYPQQRPNEPHNCWAPCITEKDGKYYLFYSPESMRLAVSDNLYDWEIFGTLFTGANMMRDPYVFLENGIYTMIYVTDCLKYRTSQDLLSWSDEKTFQENKFSKNSAQESPCVVKRNGVYYLIWCIYDGTNGCYDNRTYIFAADSIYGFNDKSPVGMFQGHAPEIISECDKDYLISVFYPNNGLNMAELDWFEI